MAYFLREKFKKREVTKKYLCITKGVPNPLEGLQFSLTISAIFFDRI